MAAVAMRDELWGTHRTGHDKAARESLILRHAHLVRCVAARFSMALPPVLDMEDAIGAGMVGLIGAVERFDPLRGVPFESYARSCIRGAILDQIRSLDVISRAARRRAREIQNAIASTQARLGRAPTNREVADQLELDVDSYRKALTDVAHTGIMLESEVGEDGEGEVDTLLSTLKDPNSPDPVSLAEKQGLMDAIADAILRLGDRERLVLALYYKEELTLREIGLVLGVTESRVCQLHSRAISRLKKRLMVWLQPDD